ncbi:hypothetical protein F3087_15590 [Nocardia colli]|uniref:Uncharacterized protein n=1 Tax=Nocardia colli TaxID=2545717 RepID=A0A5N0EGB9_9NOCA|nr:hypothetical protein [Nocardia colli]KAA8888438.1 hypothetical protein F3087_15590 [Nocardia colli]
MRPRRTISLLKESVRPTALLKESRPRRSTAILMATWLATFVLYLFVKPDQPYAPGSEPSLNTVPAAVNPAVAPR